MYRLKNILTIKKIIVCLIFLILLYECFLKKTIFNKTLEKIQKTSINHDPRDMLIKKYSRYTVEIMDELREMSRRNASYDDPHLIRVAKQLIDLPSARKFIKLSRHFMQTLQAKAIDDLLKQRKNGFFVEAGAQDGEQLSNSIFFERNRDWTGMLIEMDPYMYLQLLGKSRRAYSINACLSPYPYVTLISYRETDGGQGTIIMNKNGALPDETKGTVIPCFPLATLLIAVNVSHVDYFSLDVEGAELPILETFIRNKKIVVDTFSIEYGKGNKQEYRKYMEDNNFEVVKDIEFARPELSVYAVDFILARKDLLIK